MNYISVIIGVTLMTGVVSFLRPPMIIRDSLTVRVTSRRVSTMTIVRVRDRKRPGYGAHLWICENGVS